MTEPRWTTLAFLVGAGLSTGCPGPANESAGVGSEGVPRLRTGDSAYVVVPDGDWELAAIDFTYHNPRGQDLYHPTCRPSGGDPTLSIVVQKRVGQGWETVWSPVLPACLSEPIVIPAGGTYGDTLEVALHPQDTLYQPELNPLVEIDGTYRLLWGNLLRTYDPDRYPFGEEIPEAERVSNAFALRR